MSTPPDLNDLQTRIKQARTEGVGDEPIPAPNSETSNRNTGAKAGTELVTSMIAGGLLGYGIDHLAGTKPIFFMVFLVLGILTGFWTLYRSLKNMGSEVGFARAVEKAERSLQTQEKQAKEAQRFSGTSEEDD